MYRFLIFLLVLVISSAPFSSSFGASLFRPAGENLSFDVVQDFVSLSEREMTLLVTGKNDIEFEVSNELAADDPVFLIASSPVDTKRVESECPDTPIIAVAGDPAVKGFAYYFDLVKRGFGIFGQGDLVRSVDKFGSLFIQASGSFGEKKNISQLDILFEGDIKKRFVSRINVSSMRGPIKIVYEATRANGRLVELNDGLRILFFDNGQSGLLKGHIDEIVFVMEDFQLTSVTPDSYVSFTVRLQARCNYQFMDGQQSDLLQLQSYSNDDNYRIRAPSDLDALLSSFLVTCTSRNASRCSYHGELRKLIKRVFFRVENFFPFYSFMPVDDFGNVHHSFYALFKNIAKPNRGSFPKLHMPNPTVFSPCKNDSVDPVGTSKITDGRLISFGLSDGVEVIRSANTFESNARAVCGSTSFVDVSPDVRSIRVTSIGYRQTSAALSANLANDGHSTKVVRKCSAINESIPSTTGLYWAVYVEGPFCPVCNAVKKYQMFEDGSFKRSLRENVPIPLMLNDVDELCVEAEIGANQDLYVRPVKLRPTTLDQFVVRKVSVDDEQLYGAIPVNQDYLQLGNLIKVTSAVESIDKIFPTYYQPQATGSDVDSSNVQIWSYTVILSTLAIVLALFLRPSEIALILGTLASSSLISNSKLGFS